MTKKRTSAHEGPTTALVYTRVSSEEQARDGVSLDAQPAECRRYAAQRGWVLGHEFQDVLSGRRDDRPAYLALLAEARRLRADGQPATVVVFRLDRLGRRILERVRCREELKDLGVPLHSVREGGEVSDLVANIFASVAEEESRALGERVAASMRHIADRGWYCPGRTPWGYRLRPATSEERAQGAPISVLEPDPATAPWVQEAFFRAAGGETIRAVHRWAAALPSEARGNRVLTYRAVRQILGSSIYVGRLPSGDADILMRPVGRWRPLVDDEIWWRVQERIASHQHLPRQASQRYLVTGLLRCPNCGGRMHGKGRAGHSRSYRCTSNTSGANAVTRSCFTSVLADQVEHAVLTEVLPVVEAAVSALPALREALGRAWAALREPATVQDALQERQRARLAREAEQARSRLTNAAVLFADGQIDKLGYELLRDKAQADLRTATEALDELQPAEPRTELPPLEVVLAAAAGWGAALRDGDITARREVLAALIERVVPVRVGRGRYGVDVTWTALGEGLQAAAGPGSAVAHSSAA